ncbi:AraC family transcriptional regulator [Alcanivorax xiamenensis]|uniref:AraC family transcriptional regulator n=2 Tax=Alcanivorax xiamenensis TaxID=1177156 RepID=A0ABQ6Y7Y0_9GAMM|nr:AraC family transcriptional regulator [Alcanivorax xiamenensis]
MDNGFSLSRALLERPLLTRNRTTHAATSAVLATQLTQRGQVRPVTIKVTRMLNILVPEKGAPTQDTIARELALSTRTLTRRLAEEGSSFGGLLEQVRMERAERLLLGTALPLSRIASKLGYRDPSSFSRAFKRVTGVAPSARREAGRSST